MQVAEIGHEYSLEFYIESVILCHNEVRMALT